MNSSKVERLAGRLIETIGQGIGVIGGLTDERYRRARPGVCGPVGPQFRHILDFTSCFLDGADLGRIDYGRRQRDPEVETDRRLAIRRLRDVCLRLEGLPQVERSVLVRPEGAGFGGGDEGWINSGIARELEFLISHTIHHHALIAVILAVGGIATDEAFGVAPSTLDHWRRGAKAGG